MCNERKSYFEHKKDFYSVWRHLKQCEKNKYKGVGVDSIIWFLNIQHMNVVMVSGRNVTLFNI